MKKSQIIKHIKRIFWAGFIGILVLLLLIGWSPEVRSFLRLGALRIHLYNRFRPWLHFGNNQRCLNKLTATEVAFTPVPDSTDPSTGCAMKNVVYVSQSYIPYNHACLMTCSLAYAMYRFEKKVVQPLAQKHFGQPVVKIHHIGTYNCRPVRGYSTLLSEHAYANAIDIAGFQLQDGRIISIKTYWNQQGPEAKFLYDVAQKACKRFRRVLTPNYNAAHHDHFHFDQGFIKQCGY